MHMLMVYSMRIQHNVERLISIAAGMLQIGVTRHQLGVGNTIAACWLEGTVKDMQKLPINIGPMIPGCPGASAHRPVSYDKL